jgi:hypothetical protein
LLKAGLLVVNVTGRPDEGIECTGLELWASVVLYGNERRNEIPSEYLFVFYFK